MRVLVTDYVCFPYLCFIFLNELSNGFCFLFCGFLLDLAFCFGNIWKEDDSMAISLYAGAAPCTDD